MFLTITNHQNPATDLGYLLHKHPSRLFSFDLSFGQAYRRSCWPVNSLNDLKLAPFHLLATEGAVHTDKDHLWHMKVLRL